MWKLAFFASLVSAAVAVAYGARKERDCVTFTAWVIAANWLQFAMPWIYAPLSPAFIAYDMGFNARTEDAWAVADLLSLIAVGWKCRDVWWSPILWSVYLVTLAMHAVARYNHLMYEDYEPVLNAALAIQLAVIFSIGGGGCAEFLSDCCRRIRDVGRTTVCRASAAISSSEASR